MTNLRPEVVGLLWIVLVTVGFEFSAWSVDRRALRVSSRQHKKGNGSKKQAKSRDRQEREKGRVHTQSEVFPSTQRSIIHCNVSGCFDPLGVKGQWVYTPNRTVHTHPGCCGHGLQNVTFDFLPSPIKCKRGHRTEAFRGKKDLYQLLGDYECKCPRFVDHFTWQSPDLPSFDASRTCRLLGRRKVLLIGDSTMRQTTSFFINSLFPAGCQTQIIYRISDTLVHRKLGALNRGHHWMDYVKDTRPDIVILSLGAHVRDVDGVNATTVYRSVVDEVLDDILVMKNSSSRYRKTVFVWKTQQPRGCSKTIFNMPPEEAAHQTEEAGMYLSSGPLQYEWDLYLLSRLQELGMPYLDLRMLYSRSDGHVASQSVEFDNYGDCRHFCVGPLDVFATLFQRLLIDLRKADAERIHKRKGL